MKTKTTHKFVLFATLFTIASCICLTSTLAWIGYKTNGLLVGTTNVYHSMGSELGIIGSFVFLGLALINLGMCIGLMLYKCWKLAILSLAATLLAYFTSAYANDVYLKLRSSPCHAPEHHPDIECISTILFSTISIV